MGEFQALGAMGRHEHDGVTGGNLIAPGRLVIALRLAQASKEGAQPCPRPARHARSELLEVSECAGVVGGIGPDACFDAQPRRAQHARDEVDARLIEVAAQAADLLGQSREAMHGRRGEPGQPDRGGLADPPGLTVGHQGRLDGLGQTRTIDGITAEDGQAQGRIKIRRAAWVARGCGRQGSQRGEIPQSDAPAGAGEQAHECRVGGGIVENLEQGT